MKERFSISGWELDVDFQATEAAYVQQDELCNCAYCRNFQSAYSYFPKELTDFLKALAIDFSNPVYVFEMCKNQDGTHLYSVYYNLVGEIISDPGYKKSEECKYYPIALKEMQSTANSPICGVSSIPGHFPNPAIELQFILSMPWVLDESDDD
jgi:hypothetical protein